MKLGRKLMVGGAAVAAAGIGLTGLGGCGGQSVVSGSQWAKQIVHDMDSRGVGPATASCPTETPSVGLTFDCKATDVDGPQTVTVHVTSVHGSDVQWGWQYRS